MLILVIEDQPAFVLMLRSLLRGHVVVAYPTLKQGIEESNKQLFDLTLLDLGTEDSSPLDTIERVHEIRCPRTVVITGTDGYMKQCHEKGLLVLIKDETFADRLNSLLK